MTTKKNDIQENIENVQKIGQESVDVTRKAFEVTTAGSREIATETANYAKKAFEDGKSAFEKLTAAGSFETAIAIQSDYAKTAFEGFVAHSTKIGELVGKVAKEAFAPYAGR